MNRLYAVNRTPAGTSIPTFYYAIGAPTSVPSVGKVTGDTWTIAGELYALAVGAGLAILAVDIGDGVGMEVNIQLQQWGYPNIYGALSPGGYGGAPDTLADLIAAVKAMP